MSAATTHAAKHLATRRTPKKAAWAIQAEAIQANLQRAAEGLALVAERMSDAERAPQHLLHSAMQAATTIRASLGQRPLGKADTDHAYDAMHHPIILVDGAIALLDGMGSTVFRLQLREIYDALNEAQNNLDAVALGKMVPEVDTTVRDFILGRDLGIKLLQEARFLESTEPDASNRLRRWREGAALNNFALQHLGRVASGSQDLQAGFAAVLSGYLTSSNGPLEPQAFEVPYAEFMPGEVGADGTAVAEADESESSPTPTLFDRAHAKLEHASLQAWRSAEDDGNTSALWGITRLIDRAHAHGVFATSRDGFQQVSDDLDEAIEVIDFVAEPANSSGFVAIGALLVEVKSMVDQHIEDLK